LEKINYYLENEEKRVKIAEAGRERCRHSGYSHHERLKFLLKKLGWSGWRIAETPWSNLPGRIGGSSTAARVKGG
jgi:hypothetical protein